MAKNILMPALSPTMEEGNIVKWHVKPGDTIKSGMVIAEIETDKAIMDFEAVDGGVVESILVAEGTQGVKVMQPILAIKGEGASTSKVEPEKKVEPEQKVQVAPQQTSNSKPSAEAKPTAEAKAPAEAKTQIAPQLNQHSASGANGYIPHDYKGSTKSLTLREALRDAMAEEMRRDERVFLIGEEVAEYQGAYKVSQGLLQEFGAKRVVDTPITESGFAGIGVGAAMAGLRPIVEFMTFNFSLQAIDHIVNSAAKTLYMSGGLISSPMVFRGPNGPSARVAAQHSHDFSSIYAGIPGLVTIMASDGMDAKGLLKSAIRSNNPVVFLEHELSYGVKFEVAEDPEYLVPIGSARKVRSGKDALIVSYGACLRHVRPAIEQLSEQGIECSLVDLRTLRPLDFQTIVNSLHESSGRLVIVEEAWPYGSVGSFIAAEIASKAFDLLDGPILRVNSADVPWPYAANLEKLSFPQVQDIVKAVQQLCVKS